MMKYDAQTYEYYAGAEKYKSRLKGLDVGKNCIRFKKLEHLPLEVAKTMLRESL